MQAVKCPSDGLASLLLLLLLGINPWQKFFSLMLYKILGILCLELYSFDDAQAKKIDVL